MRILKMIPLFKVNMPKDISVDNLLHSGFIGQGKYVDLFEKKFANHFNMNFNNVLTTDSCTNAIKLALVLAGVESGDDVVTSPYTCLATNSEIMRLNANIIWYDINKYTGAADVESIKRSIRSKTKALIIAHLSGMITNDLEDIIDFCHSNDIKIIEDSAQSLGAKYKDNYFCDKTDYICFSFQAIKQLTTIDGGMLYCKDCDDIKRGKLLRWFGFDRTLSTDFRCSQDVKEVGMKIHMTDIPAYIGIKSLETIDEVIKRHKENAILYEKLLKRVEEISICHFVKSGSYFWVYPIMANKDRDELKKFLQDNGIGSSLVQNRLDNKTCFKGYKNDLPNLDYFIERILYIPCGWWVSKNDIYHIVEKIREYYN